MAVLGDARLGRFRLNTVRMGQPLPMRLSVNGTNRTKQFDRESLRIIDAIESEQNTASLEVFGFTPAVNQEIVISRYDGRGNEREFRGAITEVHQLRWKLSQGRVVFKLSCGDWTPRLRERLITAKYSSTSATTIAQAIAALAPSGFTSTARIETGLANVDTQFKEQSLDDALTQLARLVGGRWYVSLDKEIVFRVSAETADLPLLVYASNKRFYQLEHISNIDQIWNKIRVEGRGSTVPTPVGAGETIIPLEDSTDFGSGATYHANVNNQRITYTGKSAGGAGSKISGREIVPDACTAAVSSGTAGNLSVGAYKYKVTHVVAGGESEKGQESNSVTISGVDAPGSGMTGTGATGGSLVDGGDYYHWVTFVTAAGETTPSPALNTDLAAGKTQINLSSIPTSSDGRVTKRRIYRISVTAGDSAHVSNAKLVATINDNSTTSINDATADGSLGAVAPTVNTTGSGQINLTGIPTGPTGTTARKIYRTAAGGSEFRLAATISNNSATTHTDNVGDSSLGGLIPESSTVGVVAGDVRLPVQDYTQFSASGGWVKAGGQTIKFTGTSATLDEGSLTGVPASGAGSITAPLPHDTPVLVPPHISGVPASGAGSLSEALQAGDEVFTLTISEDATSQSTYGVREKFHQDRRFNRATAAAYGAALLTIYKDPRQVVTFITNDPQCNSGKPVTISMAAEWGISGTFTIMQVELSMDKGKHAPQRRVSASNVRNPRELFSILRDLERRQQG
jgi:hypothetical protein